MVKINAHADDVDISRNHKAFREALEELDNTAQETRLISNEEKHNHVSINKKTHNQFKQITIGGCRFERGFTVSYLGSVNKLQ
jgi:hypothetical protein